MAQDPVKSMNALDLMRLYGAVGYHWNLETDTIDWRGPINKLLSPDIPFSNGSSFQNCLDPNNFWARAMAMSHREIGATHYKAEYYLTLPDYDAVPVVEEGHILTNQAGQKVALKGKVRFLHPHEVHHGEPANLSGYDPLTGYPEKPVLLENLALFLEQSVHTGVSGAYLAIAVDRLMPIIMVHGMDQGRLALKSVSERLRQIIRFDDILGRTSGCCFGLILKNCDKWGVIRAADRIMKGCSDLHLPLPGGGFPVTISLGAIVYPGETSDPLSIITQGEKYLFEAQNIKGGNTAGTPYSSHTLPDYERPGSTGGPMGHRLGDRAKPTADGSETKT